MSENFWDEMFGIDDYRYGMEPNAFLAERAREVFPTNGRILSLGEGEGRNAVWLARQGFDVTAVDQSSVGLAKTRRLAKEHGVDVETIQSSAQDAPVTPESFDAVILIYLHAPPALRPRIHARAIEALRPGGVLLLEGFHPDQRRLGRTSGGPPDVAMLFTEDILREDFAGLHIEHLEHREVELAEGPGHHGTANVTRLIARKPATT